MRLPIACALVIFGASFANAQSDSHLGAAKQLDALLNSEEVFQATQDQMIDHLRQTLGRRGDTVEEQAIHDRFEQKMIDMMLGLMNRERISASQVAIYSHVFTESEIEALIEFYSTPIGQKYIAKQPEIAGEMMQEMQSIMEEMMPKIFKLAGQKNQEIKTLREQRKAEIQEKLTEE